MHMNSMVLKTYIRNSLISLLIIWLVYEEVAYFWCVNHIFDYFKPEVMTIDSIQEDRLTINSLSLYNIYAMHM